MLVTLYLCNQQGRKTIFANVQKDSILIEQQSNGIVLLSFQVGNEAFIEAGEYSVLVSAT